ncbi:YiaA/YiaB family inner membrane protein [Streptomyces sp. YIM 98790]|uniref:YiaA/YiaB family inner membrane protein n=1 Tax=Streptomyces sp. YIM 98790 TaxID=2689077 RepID=UPI001FB85826|nr:YiaA/YiaB family inner membrane protein [Streptomyces sp. YIM 98790]
MTPAPIRRPMTAAYYVQAVLSFAIALSAVAYAIAQMPLGTWERAFLALGLVYVVTSAFTLAKVVRDRQELQEMTSRVDQARLDKLINEHDPFDLKTP